MLLAKDETAEVSLCQGMSRAQGIDQWRSSMYTARESNPGRKMPILLTSRCHPGIESLGAQRVGFRFPLSPRLFCRVLRLALSSEQQALLLQEGRNLIVLNR
jgi:hypothetical protein